MPDKTYASLNTLSVFLNNLKNIFASITHTHTKNDITDFDIQEIVNEVIDQLPEAERSEF